MERNTDTTREPQYHCCLDYRDRYGLQTMGLMSSHTWLIDPKRLVFVLARYKFVAKMLAGSDKVLEIGCADAFGSRIVSQEVKSLVVSDFDPVFIADARTRVVEPFTFECLTHDILAAPVAEKFDGVYALDVIEHIAPERENRFLTHIVASLDPHGTAIIGSPSIQSQAYASPASKEGHVNCKDGSQFKRLMLEFFHNVFIFSMNDEVVHTGFFPMANYLLALCCGPR